MSSNSVEIDTPPARAFDALADARTYPEWLVGAQRIRQVDEEWPDVGSAFHHTVGFGPLRLSDRTTITAIDRPRELRLDARVGPFGAADVCFTVEARPGGRSCVTVREEPDRGPIKRVWRLMGKPLMQLGLFGRNQASLAQLRNYLEQGGRGDPADAAGKGSGSDVNIDAPS